jgi:hypothetical protein
MNEILRPNSRRFISNAIHSQVYARFGRRWRGVRKLGSTVDRKRGAKLALKTLGRVAVSLDASPLPEMMVTVGRDMVGVVGVAAG